MCNHHNTPVGSSSHTIKLKHNKKTVRRTKAKKQVNRPVKSTKSVTALPDIPFNHTTRDTKRFINTILRPIAQTDNLLLQT